MRNLIVVLACITTCFVGSAQANDARDFIQSPGSEAVGTLQDVGQDVFQFFADVIEMPDGLSVGTVNGSEADALYFAVDKNWEAETGVEKLPRIVGAASIGMTVQVEGEETTNVQPVGGLAVGLTNIKGGQLLFGIKLCSADLSDDDIDLGPFGRYHYAPIVAYRMPLGGD